MNPIPRGNDAQRWQPRPDGRAGLGPGNPAAIYVAIDKRVEKALAERDARATESPQGQPAELAALRQEVARLRADVDALMQTRGPQ